MRDPPTLETAIRDGCLFLMARQGNDGFWRDYALPPGPSSAWVTAVVGHALSEADLQFSCANCLQLALRALQSSCRLSGWGYNAEVATDADTTAWVIRCFIGSNTTIPIDPVPCLQAYLGPGGGARTFLGGPRYGRWVVEHVDVTPVVGLALNQAGVPASALEPMRRWTLEQRNGAGIWSSFWWTFDAYATARNLEFLSATGGVPREVIEHAHRYLEMIPTESETAMEAANLLMMASCVGLAPGVWASRLLYQQLANGGWPPSRVLRVPNQRTESAGDAAFEDVHGLMSTAMAVAALTRCARNGHDVA